MTASVPAYSVPAPAPAPRPRRAAASVLAVAAVLALAACNGDGDGGAGPNPIVNRAPEFTGPFAITANENEIVTLTIDVSDPDGDPITLDLVDAADAAQFTLDAGALTVTSVAPFDFENPVDEDGDNVYEFAVTAADAEFTVTQNYQVTIAEVTPQIATLERLGAFETGVFDEGAAEIVAFDPATDRLFIVNSNDATVDVVDIADPTAPALVDSIDVAAFGDGVNSVAVSQGRVALAVEADPATDPGSVVLFDTATLETLNQAPVGPLPDMLTFLPDGQSLLVANEGEPNDAYTIDPQGSLTQVFTPTGDDPIVAVISADIPFTDFDGQEDDLRAQGVRIFGPGASASQDFEPEFIAVAPDGLTAWAILQENNALAEIDIAAGAVTGVIPLGRKDFSVQGNEFDASDDDDAINIQNWPVFGLYQPDSIAVYEVAGETYLVTANEGDARSYDGFDEEGVVSQLALDPATFPNAAELQMPENIGELEITTVDSSATEIVAFGARSFSIWRTDGTLVYDSGSDFEVFTAQRLPLDFNSDNDENDSFDSRSDAKGPEPEGVTLGVIGEQTFAFIGLERVGGIMIYDITDPTAPVFNDYVNNRDFSVDVQLPDGSTNPAVGDLGPEGLVFIAAADSPTGEPLLVVANEVSGTTSIFRVVLADIIIQQ